MTLPRPDHSFNVVLTNLKIPSVTAGGYTYKIALCGKAKTLCGDWRNGGSFDDSAAACQLSLANPNQVCELDTIISYVDFFVAIVSILRDFPCAVLAHPPLSLAFSLDFFAR